MFKPFWHSPHSAFRQYFMPVSISFISLARLRPGLFDIFRRSAFRQYFMPVSISFILSGPFQARPFLTFSVIRLFGNISCPFRFRSSLWPVSDPAILTFSVIRCFGNISCPFRFRSSLWPVSGPAILTFSVFGSSAISHARFDTFRNGCSTL